MMFYYLFSVCKNTHFHAYGKIYFRMSGNVCTFAIVILTNKTNKMYKNFKKITMLLFVAASVLTAVSCQKDDSETQETTTTSTQTQQNRPYQAKESDVIGKWKVPSTSPYLGGETLEYTSAHTLNVISGSSVRTHQVWTLTGNTLESTFTTTNIHGEEWWEKIILTVKGYEEVENTQNYYADRYLTVEGVMTTNYDGVVSNTDRIDTVGVISGRLSQRVSTFSY